MNQHADKHGHDKHNHPHGGHTAAPWYTTVHRNWVFWVAVGLMLVAMAIYVLSMDEEVQPGGNLQAPMPAAN
jgi:ABC-type nickel/cobalt efflux system permease component RcnA